MKILAIETATKACSASLIIDGNCYSEFEIAPQKHANLILAMIDSLLTQQEMTGQDLDAVAFSEGPGAFTGVRVATGVIQGLAYGWQKPVIAVSTLEALLWQAHESKTLPEHSTLVACLDARMKEIYWQEGLVENGILLSQPAELISLSEAEKRLQGQYAIGDISSEYPDLVKNCAFWQESLPTAEAIAKVASQRIEKAVLVTDKVPVPVYLRNNVAEKKKG